MSLEDLLDKMHFKACAKVPGKVSSEPQDVKECKPRCSRIRIFYSNIRCESCKVILGFGEMCWSCEKPGQEFQDEVRTQAQTLDTTSFNFNFNFDKDKRLVLLSVPLRPWVTCGSVSQFQLWLLDVKNGNCLPDLERVVEKLQ